MYRSRVTHAAGWSEDRVAALKKLWLEGQSASQVAKQLGGGVTRNAVIAKIHRLGLSGRAAPSQPSRVAFKPKKPRLQAPKPQTPAVPKQCEAPLVQPQPESLSERTSAVPDLSGTAILGTLGAHMCKWPIGDPGATEFSFCGRKTEGKDVYCVEHARVAYQPKSSRSVSSQPPAWMY
ncbi:MAG: GcrA family cell cycle regulator [bacterium]|nr:GcrA family cell cycle regulator [bacterium]